MPPAADVFGYGIVLVLISACLVTPRLLHLESQFAFYASYHQDPLNRAVHLLCIWPLVATALVITDASTPLARAPAALEGLVEINASFIIAAIYAAYYLALDRKGPYGAASALGIGLCYALARALREAVAEPVPAAVAVHVGCWVAQFAGHALFERRAPALLENLAQALLMAPHFVAIEAWFALGARRDLVAAISPLVDKRLEGFAAKARTQRALRRVLGVAC
jgi:uncharacterized membrane protein YGL010W